jgi:hypothetical protein
MKTQLHRMALRWTRRVIRGETVALLSVALVAATSTARGQTLLFKDDFSGPKLSGWQPSMSIAISQSNQQLVATGTLSGPMSTNDPAASSGDGFHPIPTSGPLADDQTLEGRVDLVRANQDGVWAEIHFWGEPAAASYVFYKSANAVGLLKVWNWAASWAWFYYADGRVLKNENVTLVLAFTRRGTNVEIRTRVLDKDNGDALLFERTVTDTPQADAVLPSGDVWGVRSMGDVPGTPPPVLSAPGNVAVGVAWSNTQHGPQPAAQVIYDNIEVRRYLSPRPNVVAWGDNRDGQTGVPLEVTNAIAVAAGGNTSLALRDDGTVAAWGRGATEFPAGLSNVVAIAAGANAASDLDFGSRGCHALALQADGTVVEWQYTCPDCTPPHSTNVLTGLTNVVALATGANHSLALHADGTVTEWGMNVVGLAEVPPGLTNVVAVAAGDSQSLALRRDGTVVAWGYDTYGATNIPAGLSNVVAVAAGGLNSLALRADETAVAWGEHPVSLTNVPASLTNAVAIAAGTALFPVYGLVLRADGTVLVWGSTNSLDSFPGLTNTAGLTNVASIAAGSSHALAIIGDSPPIIQASLNHPSVTAKGFSVSVPTQNGRVYSLEYKDSLQDPEWIPLPLVTGTGRERTLTDPTAKGAQRFYRVRRW